MFANLFKHKDFIPTIVALLVLLGSAMLFFSPLLSGKKLAQSDVILIRGMSKNVEEYRETHPGEDALWSMSMFSGMPAYTIHIQYGGNILRPIWKVMNLGATSNPIGTLFWGMTSFFILLRVFGVDIRLATAGALGFGFFSYHIIITEAGHISKFLALMYAPGVLFAAAMAYRVRWYLGAGLLFFTMGLELLANHVQMTYYLAIIVILYGLYELIEHIRAGKIGRFALATGALCVAVGLAVLINLSHILPMYEYQKYSIRGASELKKEPSEEPSKKAKSKGESGGLDKEYAYGWSNGRDELLTLLVPNMKGGSSNAHLTKSMETYKMIEQLNPEYLNMRLPFYWGTQAFTSGPTYAGAIVCFLFVLGLLLVRSGVKWALLYATLLALILSLGKNSLALPAALVVFLIPLPYILNLSFLRKNILTGLSPIIAGGILVMLLDDDPAKSFTLKDLFFDYLPLYNKFRAPASLLIMLGFTLPWLAILGAQAALDPKIDKAERNKALIIALATVGGLALILGLSPGMFYSNFKSPNDEQIAGQQQLYASILKDREGMLQSDALRSFGFILAACGLLWAYINDKIKSVAAVGVGLSALIFVDLFLVDKRYLGAEEFQNESDFTANFEPTEADNAILQADKGYYRVFPLSRNPFNDGRTPYHLKTVGGYNAAKIKRYQQLIEAHIGKLTPNVMNMLNAKYIIHNKKIDVPIYTRVHQSRDGEFVYRNEANYGPAWICKDVTVAASPDEALEKLGSVLSIETALIEKKDEAKLAATPISRDSVNRETEMITVKTAENKLMRYEYNSDKNRFVTFSEVYYEKGWKAYIDGKEAPILHTNFVLRGLTVPAGKHTVEFKYDPEVLHTGKTLSTTGSVLLILTLAGLAFVEFRRANKKS